MSCVVVQVPSLRDNYSYLLHDVASGATAIIDATGGAPVRAALAELSWTLSHVLCTHHHNDHTGGNLDLGGPGVTVIGAANDADRIPGIQQHVDEGETFYIGQTPVHVWHTPGHTTGHICFLVDEVEYEGKTSPAVFVGDTLFAMGCGRLFEGSAQQMWRSLRRLGDLVAHTRIFCAHEYTESNGRFALRVYP